MRMLIHQYYYYFYYITTYFASFNFKLDRYSGTLAKDRTKSEFLAQNTYQRGDYVLIKHLSDDLDVDYLAQSRCLRYSVGNRVRVSTSSIL